MKRFAAAVLAVLMLAGCQPMEEIAVAAREMHSGADAEPALERDAGGGDAVPADTLQRLARPARGDASVCRTFARAIAEAALESDGDVERFLARIRAEFVDGDSDPFALKEGLRERRWNDRYFYAGHGGFRPEYDDAQRYPRGGNHQPGHFISVLSIAADFGEEQARLAIAFAGDYDEGDEDDLRLSNIAIPLGAGLRDGSVTPGEVAVRARELCRS
jgi:hypothetical protein